MKVKDELLMSEEDLLNSDPEYLAWLESLEPELPDWDDKSEWIDVTHSEELPF